MNNSGVTPELLNRLYFIEKALKDYWPAYQEEYEAKQELAKIKRETTKGRSRGEKVLIRSVIIVEVLLVLICIYLGCIMAIATSTNSSGLFGTTYYIDIEVSTNNWLTLSANTGVFYMLLGTFVVIGLITSPMLICEVIANRKLPMLNQKVESAAFRHRKKQKQYLDLLTAAAELMPKECIDPQYARIFISYLETGQANTLPQAWQLFEQHVHRERMERLAREQLEKMEKLRRYY